MESAKPNTKNNKHQVIVSVGSNIDPESNIALSQEILAKEVCFIAQATVIETKPDGYQDQPDFLNGAFLLQTDLDYEEFNQYLKEVENRMGRVKGPIKSGPRCIDLDIIVWDRKIVHSDYTNNKYYVVNPVNELVQKHRIELT